MPIRFIILICTPQNAQYVDVDVFEVANAMGTLMSDEVGAFHWI